MNAKEVFTEVFKAEKESIRRVTGNLNRERDNIYEIEEILKEKSEEELNTLVLVVVKKMMRQQSESVLDLLKENGK